MCVCVCVCVWQDDGTCCHLDCAGYTLYDLFPTPNQTRCGVCINPVPPPPPPRLAHLTTRAGPPSSSRRGAAR